MGADARLDDAAARTIGERLAALYRDIGERSMRDLPVYNPALGVEAVGFHAYEGRALGIVVTPWFMNIVLAPLEQAESAAPVLGTTVRRALPAASFDFTVGTLDGLGHIESCSLFSPMHEFADQASAHVAAEAALAAVCDPQFDKADADDPASTSSRPAAGAIDRRSLLRGQFSGTRP
jgi:[NiFe] hydrogenase assembly HybE family chaperone